MLSTGLVTIDLAGKSSREYIIRDHSGITIGRVFIIDFSKVNKFSLIRIKFYKQGYKSYGLLRNSLNIMMGMLFQSMGLNKIDVLTDDSINLDAFVDSGFEFEGIVSNSVKTNLGYGNEILFGLDFSKYKNMSIKRNIHIKGKNIYVNMMSPKDAQALLEYYIKNRDYLKEFEPHREEKFYTLDFQKKNLIESYKDFLNGRNLNFGIYKDVKLIGKIQISNIIIGIFKSAFVGYSIDKDEQGKGYMKEALNLVVKYAFEEMKLHRLEASTLVDNFKSQAVLTACGFAKLGLNKKYLFISGKWRDHITFYKLNPGV